MCWLSSSLHIQYLCSFAFMEDSGSSVSFDPVGSDLSSVSSGCSDSSSSDVLVRDQFESFAGTFASPVIEYSPTRGGHRYV